MNRDFSISNQLYDRALKSIPLASQTFSKSAQNYVKGVSPLFIERGLGAYVWDPDGNQYIDFVLGLMPIILGYRDRDVDRAIKDQVDKGILFSLPNELEITLAEELINIIPSAEMVRYGKNGSDVTSAAIRLARAYTNRNRIAICGYHGWHDWYIGTTSRNAGVPKDIRELSTTFPFNDVDALEHLLKSDPDGFAAVILEPEGIYEPQPDFLKSVRQLTDKYGVVLVFDEIITGFRVAMGGSQEKHQVTPDLSTFGKALGNGMPISAIVGRKEIMNLMTEIFFSSTFGGEVVSLAAALATLKKLRKLDAPTIFERVSARIRSRLSAAIERTGLTEVVSLGGVSWWPRLIIYPHIKASHLLITSLLRQELLANGILIGSSFNFCIRHDDDQLLDETGRAFEQSFERLAEHLNAENPATGLLGEMIQPIFQVRG